MKRYWLFHIMWEYFPNLWKELVKNSIASQNYGAKGGDDRGQGKRNVTVLKRLSEKDMIVAAFGKYKFTGYGELQSILNEDWEPHKSQHFEGDWFSFLQQFKCKWHPIPPDKEPNYIEYRNNESNLTPGLCVKEISSTTFNEIKSRIDNEIGLDKKADALDEIVLNDIDSRKAEELTTGPQEGNLITRFVNIYERRPELRIAAVKIHGLKCKACNFDFASTYGERGASYIEVHHLKPISTFGKEMPVNPQTDMTVVCANCHRMIHRKKEQILSIDELKSIIRQSV